MKFNPEIVKKLQYNPNDKDTTRNLSILDKFLRLKQNIGENWFFEAYDEDNLESPNWKEVEFINYDNQKFSASNIQLSNDSANLFMFSWNGDDIAGILYPGEALPFSQLEREKIYLKMKGKIRLFAF